MGEDREDTAESPLDLGLRDLLVLHEESVRGTGDEAPPDDPSTSTSLEQAEPLRTPEPSAYASLAVTGDWSALVRRCEEEGLKTALSRVWWMRAHLEGGSMPASLLAPAWERAQREEPQEGVDETAAESAERRDVLSGCRRWFSAEEITSNAPASGEIPPSTDESRSEKSPRAQAEVKNKSQVTAASAPTEFEAPEPKKAAVAQSRSTPAPWVRRGAVIAAMLLVIGGAFFALSPFDDLPELKASPMPDSPMPEVPLEIRFGELAPLSGLEVLHVAMEELVKTKVEGTVAEEVIQKKTVKQPVAPPVSASPSATLSPAKNDLMMDGPVEPIAVRDRRLHPERDPGPAGNGRGEGASFPSVWDQIGGVVTSSPQKGGRASDPNDFFDSIDDHPGYPVERFKNPLSCQLAVGGPVRTRPSDFAPTTFQLEQGDSVMVEEQMGPWLKLRGRSGRPGYIKSACRGTAENPRREDDDAAEWKR